MAQIWLGSGLHPADVWASVSLVLHHSQMIRVASAHSVSLKAPGRQQVVSGDGSSLWKQGHVGACCFGLRVHVPVCVCLPVCLCVCVCVCVCVSLMPDLLDY